MPAIFGAFGNFLLPTQLGVHDVAFPRLNSAAFWFLPGGLIMLCQLVCVDRRYQRMNCFNIRELQGILKRKFFTDLVNTSDSHKLVESTLINMRHKNNMSNILMYDQSLLYNFDLTNTSKNKNFSFLPGKIFTYEPTYNFFNFITKTSLSNYFINYIQLKNMLVSLLKDIVYFLHLPTIISLSTLPNSVFYLKYTLTNSLNLTLPSLNILLTTPLTSVSANTSTNLHQNTTVYTSSNINYSSFNNLSSSAFAENSSS
jgi:hypothetical protein